MTEAPEPLPPRVPRDGGRAGAVTVGIAVALVVALAAITVAGRTLRAPVAPLAFAVTVLPYLYASSAALLFAAWCVLPDRRSLPGLLAAVLLAAGLSWGPSWSEGAGDPGLPVRVMTWNVRRLWGGPADGGDPYACVVAGVRAEDPDLVAFLEVTAEDTAGLAADLGLDCTHVDYRNTGSPTAGGLAACARLPWHLVAGDPQIYVDGDDWHYMFSEMQSGGRVVNLLAVHLHPYYPGLTHQMLRSGVRDLAAGDPETLLDAGEEGVDIIRVQGAQAVALLARVEKFHDPTLVVGDFNSTRDSSLHTSLRRVLADAWEHAGHGFGGTARLDEWLPLRVDYVYATDAFAVRDAHVHAADCSDHRPVVADLVLRDLP